MVAALCRQNPNGGSQWLNLSRNKQLRPFPHKPSLGRDPAPSTPLPPRLAAVAPSPVVAVWRRRSMGDGPWKGTGVACFVKSKAAVHVCEIDKDEPAF